MEYAHSTLNPFNLFEKQLKLWLNAPEIAIAPLSKHVETKDVLILAA